MRAQLDLPRAHRILLFALIAVSLLVLPAARAAEYPIKTVRVIVPFPAGGNADVFARIMAKHMAESVGQSVVVENRAGAAGMIGTDAVAKSAPDGYTLLMGTTGTHTTNPAVYPKLPYDPLRDFVPVSNFADSPFLIVSHPSLPVRDLKQLVTLAKKRPGELRYASFGTGSSAHLVGEMLRLAAKIDIVHVPYKGGPPALADVMGGHVELAFNVVPAIAPLSKAGKVRALALAAAKRANALPSVPTFEEQGYRDFHAGSWYGFFAPAGTPKDIVDKLGREIVRILALPEVRQQLLAAGADPIGNSPQQFAAQMRDEMARWARVAKAANVRVD
jgi:tripartite-type tricarboxylate transporter receptor subunit TctC